MDNLYPCLRLDKVVDPVFQRKTGDSIYLFQGSIQKMTGSPEALQTLLRLSLEYLFGDTTFTQMNLPSLPSSSFYECLTSFPVLSFSLFLKPTIFFFPISSCLSRLS